MLLPTELQHGAMTLHTGLEYIQSRHEDLYLREIDVFKMCRNKPMGLLVNSVGELHPVWAPVSFLIRGFTLLQSLLLCYPTDFIADSDLEHHFLLSALQRKRIKHLAFGIPQLLQTLKM